MAFTSAHIAYQATGYFSDLVKSYLNGDKALMPFYEHLPSLSGIKNAIQQRSHFKTNRRLLVNELYNGYEGIALHPKVKENINLLLEDNTYTVCTAHQPNLFTGHLYFVYKILHAVKLAEDLNTAIAGKNFVPVYFMGSEDADLEELGVVEIDGKEYRWNTAQQGAVGRMVVDDALINLLDEMEGQLGVLPFGAQAMTLLKASYVKGSTIEQATIKMVNALTGHLGVVVLLPDTRGFKGAFAPILKNELSSQFSAAAVNETLTSFSEKFKAQAAGRALNLFYLGEGIRKRIEKDEQGFKVVDSDWVFSEAEVWKLLEEQPECFSPNVILRPVFQEYILPNVAFIGGGGELAYWLELKKVFEQSAVPYPVLLLRNSFMLIRKKWSEKLQEWSLQPEDLFLPKQELVNRLVKQKLKSDLSLREEIDVIEKMFDAILPVAVENDGSLQQHVPALKKLFINKMETLEKKIQQAARKRESVMVNQVNKIYADIFPHDSLQERVSNIFPFIARWGMGFIDELYLCSSSFNQEFTLISEQ